MTNNSLPLLTDKIAETGKKRQKLTRKFLDNLKRRQPGNLDTVIRDFHDEVFENTDCLSCANCCKTTSPVFYQNDIERIAKRVSMKPVAFIDKYLKMDEESDYVLKSAPCSFLDLDNTCLIYEDRPAACKTYPHTNRKRFHQIIHLAYQNSFICPAVQTIIEKLQTVYK